MDFQRLEKAPQYSIINLMTTLAVITTFPPNRWQAYAKRMLESHIKFWPDDVKLYAYHEGDKPDLQHDKIEYVNIEEVNPELVKFKQRHNLIFWSYL